MKKQSVTLRSSAGWLRLLLVFFLFSTLSFWGCDKAKEAVQPESFKSSQAQRVKSGKEREEKDDKYKTDKTGQYVGKHVQVPDYGGKERPARPKHDAATSLIPLPDCDEPCTGGGGGTTVTSTFVSSEMLIDPNSAPNAPFSGDIYALRIIKGDNPYILPSQGHIKINVDLNKGAGGKYIYLTFSREPQYSYEHVSGLVPVSYTTPITYINVEAHTQLGSINDGAAPGDYFHMYRFDGEYSHRVDLNDGTGGRYIFGHVNRAARHGTLIKEVGILYGNSSSIEPPTGEGWVKVGRDLNEGAGGDYIYFCYKK